MKLKSFHTYFNLKKTLIITLFLGCFGGGFFSFQKINAQPLGIKIEENKSSVTIPFELKNNLIVLPVKFNENLSLKFILDTGASYTILTHKEIADLMRVKYGKKVTIYGADRSIELEAQIAHHIQLGLPKLQMRDQNIIVLKEDYLQLENLIGEPIHGILGTELFKRFIIKIDYQRELLTFYERSDFIPPKKQFTDIPIRIFDGKPYLQNATVIMEDTTSFQPTLLIDSGASLPFVLHPNKNKEITIEKDYVKGNVGYGLGGALEGYLRRIPRLEFGDYEFGNIIASLQDLTHVEDSLRLNIRQGFIGGEILKRFTLIIDYHKAKMYLRPNKAYSQEIKEDKSGLILIATGLNLKQIMVKEVIKDSPADNVGVQVDDQIIRANSMFYVSASLGRVAKLFQGKNGKKIKLIIKRNGQRIHLQFNLEKYL